VTNSGYAGAWANYHPLSISSRGNDFTFWAQASFLHRKFVELAMKRADLHIAECARDEVLARAYGFGPSKPSLVSHLGVDLEEFRVRPRRMSLRHKLAIPPDVPLIINTRGAGLWYNLDVFLKGIPLVLAKFPEARFLVRLDGSGASSMVMRRLVDKLGIGGNVHFFPYVDHSEMAGYLAAADIIASLSRADGVPVSMLEGMACGAVPVMSRQPAIAEWIEDGWNGYLVDPEEPRQLAEAIIRLLSNREKMAQFRKRNLELVRRGADVRVNARRILEAMTSLASYDSG